MTDGLILLVGGIATGLFGSLLGLGGGILIVPLLTLGFGFPLLTAVGVSLVCVIVTSGAAAGVYLDRHVANLRLGMALELFTATGALVGGLIAFAIPERILEGLFAALLAYVSITMLRRGEPAPPLAAESSTDAVPAKPSFTERLSGPGYRVHRYPAGVAGSIFSVSMAGPMRRSILSATPARCQCLRAMPVHSSLTSQQRRRPPGARPRAIEIAL